MKLTQKQEKFALNLFSGMTQSKAYMEAGYACKALTTFANNASRLAKKAYILQRLDELKAKAESDKVMSVKERKERLSEIARAKLTDLVELGQDGSWVNIGPETPHGAAIQEIHSRTEYDDDGSKPTVYTSVKLHDPMKAIDIMNKMDKVYSDGATVNVDNRKIEIIVNDKETKELTERLLSGELPAAKTDTNIQG